MLVVKLISRLKNINKNWRLSLIGDGAFSKCFNLLIWVSRACQEQDLSLMWSADDVATLLLAKIGPGTKSKCGQFKLGWPRVAGKGWSTSRLWALYMILKQQYSKFDIKLLQFNFTTILPLWNCAWVVCLSKKFILPSFVWSPFTCAGGGVVLQSN